MTTLDADAAKEKLETVETLALKELARRNYFPTMIFQGEIQKSKDLNRDLLSSVYSLSDRGKSVDIADAGWAGSLRSAKNLHKKPEFGRLKDNIQSALASISSELRYSRDHFLKITFMWSNINPSGSGSRAECRPGSLWTGCYCVQVPKGAGSMKFIDPRTINIMNPPKYEKDHKPRDCFTKVSFNPRAGRFVIFPAWLYHEIEPNLAEEKEPAGDFVYISFNAIQAKK